MKVLWIADYGLHHSIGGAQRSDNFLTEEGQNRGHSISFLYHDSDRHVLDNEYDVVVSANLEALFKDSRVFDYLTDHPRHVRVEHDSNSYLPSRMRQDLFGSTQIAFFLCDYHHEQFRDMYDIDNYLKKVVYCYDYIDPKQFYDHQKPRENSTLYVGFLHVLKGTMNFFDEVLQNPDKKYVIAGWGSPHLERVARSFKNLEWLGKVDYEDMPKLYNKYQKLYYHPEKFEPFCRSVGEAILCGMDLDVSDNIGAKHILDEVGKEAMSQGCAEAPKVFWDNVEALL
jgi:hypothetical protein